MVFVKNSSILYAKHFLYIDHYILFKRFIPLIMILMAKIITKIETLPPVKPNNIFLTIISISLPNTVNIVASRVIIDTQAEVKLIALAAE